MGKYFYFYVELCTVCIENTAEKHWLTKCGSRYPYSYTILALLVFLIGELLNSKQLLIKLVSWGNCKISFSPQIMPLLFCINDRWLNYSPLMDFTQHQSDLARQKTWQIWHCERVCDRERDRERRRERCKGEKQPAVSQSEGEQSKSFTIAGSEGVTQNHSKTINQRRSLHLGSWALWAGSWPAPNSIPQCVLREPQELALAL